MKKDLQPAGINKDECVMGTPTSEGISDDLPVGKTTECISHGSGCGVSK